MSRAADVLDRIVERADETIQFVQRVDAWHWRRFLADIPLVDPELLAVGGVAARFDERLLTRLQEHPASPARVALLSAIQLGEEPPRSRPLS